MGLIKPAVVESNGKPGDPLDSAIRTNIVIGVEPPEERESFSAEVESPRLTRATHGAAKNLISRKPKEELVTCVQSGVRI